MPCYAALVEKILVFRPDTLIEVALKDMRAGQMDYAPVVNQNGVIEGVFSLEGLMKNLLPVSVAMADGYQLDVTVRAAPGVAKRLRNVLSLPVETLMDRKFSTVSPQTPIWEGVNALVSQGSPLCVVEGETGKFVGLITSASILEELQRMQESEG